MKKSEVKFFFLSLPYHDLKCTLHVYLTSVPVYGARFLQYSNGSSLVCLATKKSLSQARHSCQTTQGIFRIFAQRKGGNITNLSVPHQLGMLGDGSRLLWQLSWIFFKSTQNMLLLY